ELASAGELVIEDSLPAPADEAIADEPIDDDLGVVTTSALAERRRSVVVAAMLEGATPDALRPIAKSLGELAYQRGGVLLGLDDAALLVAFGLEVAGEDDVAIAMGWALDAAAMTRDADATLRIGARTGVATTGAARDRGGS